MNIVHFQKKVALLLAGIMIFSLFSAFPQATVKAVTTAKVELQQSGGDFETAFVTWKAVSNATEYRVYVATAASGNYTRLDDELIRNYGDYFRADAVGIKAGNYVLKVEAYNGSALISSAVSDSIDVKAHDRSGYAFVNGTSSGAYNDDGTLKSNAVVIYITEDTKDSVKMDVKTSAKGATTSCSGITEILTAYKKGYETRPLCIRIIGKVTNSGALTTNKDFKGDMLIDTNKNNSGITIEGIGNDAVAYGWGVRIKNSSNIEVRNLGFMACNSGEGDNVGLQQDNDHIWVHNNDMFYGMAGKDADQAKGDGALDTKKSTYVTHSYNHFWDCGKCNLLGLSEGTTEGLYITYHHNWYDHSDSRHPRVRYYSAHVYNNYYDGNSKYGVGATLGSSVFVENNYFRNCQYPILTSMQGSDVYAGGTKRDTANNATFSKENGGSIKATGNIMVGRYTFIAYGCSEYVLKGQTVAYNLSGTTSTKDFDAIVLDRNEKVDSSITAYAGGGTYNNFDTKSDFYTYKVDAAEDVPAIVTKWAGRAYGGDFTWTFDDAKDDFDYGVNAALKAAVVGYQSKLVYVGGSATAPTTTPLPSNAAPTQQPGTTATPTPAGQGGDPISAGSYNHDFTKDGKTSSVFTISGNLSTSKGTVNYNGLTLTQCLKMESATSISFTTASKATLTLIFNETFSGNTYIDDVKIGAKEGVLTIEIEAGSHVIKKGDSANLFYILLTAEASSDITPTPTKETATTPVPSKEITATPTPTKAATATPTPSKTAAATPVPTDTPAPTDAPVSSAVPTKTPINIPGLITATPAPTVEVTPTATPLPTVEASSTPAPTVEATATPAPTAEATTTPTAAAEPSETPTANTTDSDNTSGTNVAVVVLIIAAVLLLCLGGYGYLRKRSGKSKESK